MLGTCRMVDQGYRCEDTLLFRSRRQCMSRMRNATPKALKLRRNGGIIGRHASGFEPPKNKVLKATSLRTAPEASHGRGAANVPELLT